jgi:hypothetical protein
MKAHTGDTLTISGHQVGEPNRVGTIEEVRGADGAPPYRVRWSDSDHVTLLFPGPDCSIEPVGAESEGAGDESQ